jgi:uncharacterized protein
MALPRILKNMNLFGNGSTWLGLVMSVALPKLTRQTEDYRAGGLDAPVKLDMGMEALELEFTLSGMVPDALDGFGSATIAGAYQQDDTGAVSAVEVVVRGRIQEIDMGDAKPGEKTEHKYKINATYYKLSIAGADKIEVDVLGMVMRVNGIDRLAEQRAAIGA